MGDVKRGDEILLQPGDYAAEGEARGGDAIKRKRRKLKAGPAWQGSDLGAVASLVLLLPAAWLHDCVSVPKSSP